MNDKGEVMKKKCEYCRGKDENEIKKQDKSNRINNSKHVEGVLTDMKWIKNRKNKNQKNRQMRLNDNICSRARKIEKR